jgi:hypothetical protein
MTPKNEIVYTPANARRLPPVINKIEEQSKKKAIMMR